jgi:monothiol glutaredoxin
MSDQSTQIRDAIAEAIKDNDVILFMKGTPDGPACGFSARAVAALEGVGAKFAAVDILPDPRLRQELTAISSWPTIPQLFVGGELLGGSDIIVEMYESGELAEAVGVEQPEGEAPPVAEAAAQPAGPAPLGIENRLG